MSKTSAKLCKPQGAASVWLHTEPRSDAALVDDAGKRPGAGSTFSVYDHSARATAGQRYALAGTSGEWTANLVPRPEGVVPEPALQPHRGPRERPAGHAHHRQGQGVRQGPTPRGRPTPRACRYQEHAHAALHTCARASTTPLAQTLKGSYLAAGSYNPAKHVTVRGEAALPPDPAGAQGHVRQGRRRPG
ncbi:hypothetical protein [Nonomuraea dietziae]|uniref:hypothetical protein n=1 Tax=Nonomuraea dietziae TaxID=65515 RepID=UPI0031DD3836